MWQLSIERGSAFTNSSGVLSPPEAPLHFLLLKPAPEKDTYILIAN